MLAVQQKPRLSQLWWQKKTPRQKKPLQKL
jgi:hypothetical protein